MKKLNRKELKKKYPTLKIRSKFSAMKMSGAGAHKSKKDYDRKNSKKEIKKYMDGDY